MAEFFLLMLPPIGVYFLALIFRLLFEEGSNWHNRVGAAASLFVMGYFLLLLLWALIASDGQGPAEYWRPRSR